MQPKVEINMPKLPLPVFIPMGIMNFMIWQKLFGFTRTVPKMRMNLTHFQCTGLGLYTLKVKVLKKILN